MMIVLLEHLVDAAANGFMISASSSTVLGFSLTGAVIPAGSGTLLENVDCTQGQLDSFVFSGQGGTALTVDWGEGGEPPCDDIDNDDICDDVDDCVGEYDECGVCNGPGATVQDCWFDTDGDGCYETLDPITTCSCDFEGGADEGGNCGDDLQYFTDLPDQTGTFQLVNI